MSYNILSLMNDKLASKQYHKNTIINKPQSVLESDFSPPNRHKVVKPQHILSDKSSSNKHKVVSQQNILTDESLSNRHKIVNPQHILTDSSLSYGSVESVEHDTIASNKKSHRQINISTDINLTTDDKVSFNQPNPINYEQQRVFDMTNMRIKWAENHRHDNSNSFTINDEHLDMLFTKGLPHDKEGLVDKMMMNKLLEALKYRDNNKLAKLGNIKLVDPSAAWSNDIIGACSNTYPYTNTKINPADMVELYCMSLARDIKFSHYIMSSIIDDCRKYLNSAKLYSRHKERYFLSESNQIPSNKVTHDNIFRGPMCADLQGSYISQFLYRDVKIGGVIHKQKYLTDMEGYDYMRTWTNATSMHNGKVLEIRQTPRDIPR